MNRTVPPSYIFPSAYRSVSLPSAYADFPEVENSRQKRVLFLHCLQTPLDDLPAWQLILDFIYHDLTTSYALLPTSLRPAPTEPPGIDQLGYTAVAGELFWRIGLNVLWQTNRLQERDPEDALIQFYQLLLCSNCRGHYRCTFNEHMMLDFAMQLVLLNRLPEAYQRLSDALGNTRCGQTSLHVGYAACFSFAMWHAHQDGQANTEAAEFVQAKRYFEDSFSKAMDSDMFLLYYVQMLRQEDSVQDAIDIAREFVDENPMNPCGRKIYAQLLNEVAEKDEQELDEAEDWMEANVRCFEDDPMNSVHEHLIPVLNVLMSKTEHAPSVERAFELATNAIDFRFGAMSDRLKSMDGFEQLHLVQTDLLLWKTLSQCLKKLMVMQAFDEIALTWADRFVWYFDTHFVETLAEFSMQLIVPAVVWSHLQRLAMYHCVAIALLKSVLPLSDAACEWRPFTFDDLFEKQEDVLGILEEFQIDISAYVKQE